MPSLNRRSLPLSADDRGPALLKMLGRGWAFSRAELIVVYAMMLVGSVVVTTGFTGSFLSIITGAAYYAPLKMPGRAFRRIYPPLANPHRYRGRAPVLRGTAQGSTIPWSAWSRPLVAWICFIFAFYWVLFCLGVLLRGQWVANERLVFPLTRLPLAMLEGADSAPLLGGLFKNRLLWLGFAVPLFILSWNSLNYYHDAFQPIALTGSLSCSKAPSACLADQSADLGPSLPDGTQRLLQYLVFLFILHPRESRLRPHRPRTRRWRYLDLGGGSVPVSHQQAGGLLVLTLFVMWTARTHLSRLWSQALKGEPAPGELMAPRTAFGGLAIGVAFVVAWLTLNRTLSIRGGAAGGRGAHRLYRSVAHRLRGGYPRLPNADGPAGFHHPRRWPRDPWPWQHDRLGLSTVWMGETAANMMNAVMHSLKLTSGDSPAPRWLPWALLAAIAVGLLARSGLP